MTYKEYLEKIKFFSPKTIDIYLKYSEKLERYQLNYRAVLIEEENTSVNTKRLIISAMKSYYKYLGNEIWRDIELPKKTIVVKEFITYEQYKSYLLKINRNTKTGLQKRIIIRLLFETGLRSSELLQIKKEHIRNNQIKIFGKGRRQRVVSISNWLQEEIEYYISQINTSLLFPFGYKNLYNRISILDKNKKISPHMFRRGYAKYCFEKGINIYDISLSMGHSSIETTTGYIKRESEDVNIQEIFK